MKARRTLWRALCLALPLALLLLLGASHTALAAAAMGPVSSTPDNSSTVTSVPHDVSVTFTDHLRADQSDMAVYDARGVLISPAHSYVDPSNSKRLVVPVKANGSSQYLTVWHVVSADNGQAQAGSFDFGVGSTAQPGVGYGASGQAATTSGFNWGLALLCGLIGLLIGAAAMYLLTRSKMMPAVLRTTEPTTHRADAATYRAPDRPNGPTDVRPTDVRPPRTRDTDLPPPPRKPDGPIPTTP